MPHLTDDPRRQWAGALGEPRTPEGQNLIAALAPHLPRMAAAAAEHDGAGTFPVESFKQMTADGILAATVPQRFGGMGVHSVHDLCLAIMRIAEADASIAICLHMQLSRGITMRYELNRGNPAGQVLAERLLRLMGSGEAIISGALKDAGTVTELRPAGAGLHALTGRKILVSMAPFATHFVVSARTRPATGLPHAVSVFLSARTPGLTVPGNWSGMGMRASASTEVIFDDCHVPETDLFLRGPLGVRDEAAMAGQTVSSIGLLGVYAGIAQSARDITVAGLIKRGSSAAAVRTQVAEVDAKLYSMRTALAAALDNADRYAEQALPDPDERGRIMMAPFQYAKLIVNRCAAAVVEECMTLTGGASFTDGHPLARRYRDVRAGWFMQPFTYADAVDRLSAWSLNLDY
ncbi:acyl-CoA dehydrogenase family protein [Micromonospora ureilytica]|uniref:acyl-CoA dehydrogenase family protein n=1 Tax=Micromonospora ureilytica TaxID=709868 RepID=UPI00340339F5